MTQTDFVNALRSALSRLLARAWEDVAFKQALLTEPSAAIEQAIGLKPPANMSVQVVETAANATASVALVGGAVQIMLPAGPTMPDGELLDADLEVVAGGAGFVPTQRGYRDPHCR